MLAVALLLGEWEAALLLAALSGACLGFAPWNRSPARIFMGDVGAQFLGYVLAVSSILGLFKLPAAVGFLAPLLAMGLPLCDTAFAFFRRIAHGRSPFAADRGHLHHRLLAAGYSQRQAVAILLAISALCGLLAILLVAAAQTVHVLCLSAIVVVLLGLGAVRRS
jgi:UDP-GlcNAc:undecaprenyl-phosphate GlcNAc-1-phosphate transferase